MTVVFALSLLAVCQLSPLVFRCLVDQGMIHFNTNEINMINHCFLSSSDLIYDDHSPPNLGCKDTMPRIPVR